MTFSAHAWRPLFVPAGILVVRTGPTTRAELERLLDDDEHQHSGIRPIRPIRPIVQFVRAAARVACCKSWLTSST